MPLCCLPETEIMILDTAFLAVLSLEVVLKMIAFGTAFCRDCMSMFDAVVLLVSFVLGILIESLQSVR